jgi:hypothetical protein
MNKTHYALRNLILTRKNEENGRTFGLSIQLDSGGMDILV